MIEPQEEDITLDEAANEEVVPRPDAANDPSQPRQKTISANQFLNAWHRAARKCEDRQLSKDMTKFEGYLQDQIIKYDGISGDKNKKTKKSFSPVADIQAWSEGKGLKGFSDTEQSFIRAASGYMTATNDERREKCLSKLQKLSHFIELPDDVSNNVKTLLLRNALKNMVHDKALDNTVLDAANIGRLYAMGQRMQAASFAREETIPMDDSLTQNKRASAVKDKFYNMATQLGIGIETNVAPTEASVSGHAAKHTELGGRA